MNTGIKIDLRSLIVVVGVDPGKRSVVSYFEALILLSMYGVFNGRVEIYN